MQGDSPLKSLDNKKLGPFLTEMEYWPKKRVGHFDVSIFIQNKKGRRSCSPVVSGIFSKGNRIQHIFPWFDIHYIDQIDFGGKNPVKLSEKGSLTIDLFRWIGRVIPSGGMIFLSYLTDILWGMKSELHEFTRQSLSLSSLRIPPAATPLGYLLFMSGCRNIKSEAYDVQGSGRLAGEKSLNTSYEVMFSQKLFKQLRLYLNQEPNSEFAQLEKTCRSQGTIILNTIKKELISTNRNR